ncbi:Uncharacterised protein [Mycobacteroides abscessus subsp. abscessus]|nr:Uncharacterised protein [Mycobacteroides abscessus subsp. abscessus]
MTPSSRSARVTAGLVRSTAARLPSYNRYIWLFTVTSAYRSLGISWLPFSRVTLPAITVVVTVELGGGVATSHTVQMVSSPVNAPGIEAGAPGIPTSGPRRAFASSESLTGLGFSLFPEINRAEARLSAGCSVSWMRT